MFGLDKTKKRLAKLEKKVWQLKHPFAFKILDELKIDEENVWIILKRGTTKHRSGKFENYYNTIDKKSKRKMKHINENSLIKHAEKL